jgi:hypothetical protein
MFIIKYYRIFFSIARILCICKLLAFAINLRYYPKELKKTINMCKQCELKGIVMDLQALDVEQVKKTSSLPLPWPELIEGGFHQDLVDRAYAYLGWIQKRNNPKEIKNARAVLASTGKAFKEPFSKDLFPLEPKDPFYELKIKALDSITELSIKFGNRVDSTVWNSFAHLAVRENPELKKSILSEQDLLPHHYGIVDTNLHAAGKVYTFMLQVQSTFFRHTGCILIHNCDCSCSLINLKKIDGAISFNIKEESDLFECTQSLLTHKLAESHLLINEKLPFEFSITKEAQELFGLCQI